MKKIKSSIELRYDEYEKTILAHQKPSPTVIQFIVELIFCLFLLPALIPVSIYAILSLIFTGERRDEQ